ncbi:hypothetical protein Gpo141_00011581 [Globisporangium polare]
MPLLGLVRRVLAQAHNKRLLKRLGDKYADIRLSGATQRASQCSSSHASPVASRAQSTPSQNSSPPLSATTSSTRRASNYSISSPRSSQSRLSVSVCVVVPVQSAEALWIDKLRAQEESYRRSVSGESSVSTSNRRRCESEDEAFELWDYVCPQLLRPKLANEWV